MNDIQFRKNYSAFISPEYIGQAEQKKIPPQKPGNNAVTFDEILQKNIKTGDNGLKFSKHALKRIDARNIDVSPQLVAQMNSAVDKADGKGVKGALILSGTTAFIVNVPSKTVVTAMDSGEMKENIFTNIDGAVII